MRPVFHLAHVRFVSSAVSFKLSHEYYRTVGTTPVSWIVSPMNFSFASRTCGKTHRLLLLSLRPTELSLEAEVFRLTETKSLGVVTIVHTSRLELTSLDRSRYTLYSC